MTHEHQITLRGAAVDGRGTSGQLVAGLFGVFAQGTERALRYRLEGRSTAPGAFPASLRPASDFELLKIAASKGVRTFEVHARPLFESMPERFAQGQLFDEIDPQTGIVILMLDGNVIQNVLARQFRIKPLSGA